MQSKGKLAYHIAVEIMHLFHRFCPVAVKRVFIVPSQGWKTLSIYLHCMPITWQRIRLPESRRRFMHL